MAIKRQITVPVANQPGTIAGVAEALFEGKIQLEGLTVFEGGFYIIPADPVAAVEVLRKAGYPSIETDVLCVELPDKPGSLARLTRKLADGGINVDLAYSAHGPEAGTETLVLVVSDLDRAEALI
jgi:hypothetical protein